MISYILVGIVLVAFLLLILNLMLNDDGRGDW